MPFNWFSSCRPFVKIQKSWSGSSLLLKCLFSFAQPGLLTVGVQITNWRDGFIHWVVPDDSNPLIIRVFEPSSSTMKSPSRIRSWFFGGLQPLYWVDIRILDKCSLLDIYLEEEKIYWNKRNTRVGDCVMATICSSRLNGDTTNSVVNQASCRMDATRLEHEM